MVAMQHIEPETNLVKQQVQTYYQELGLGIGKNKYIFKSSKEKSKVVADWSSKGKSFQSLGAG